MNIPGLGKVTNSVSKRIPVALFGGKKCRFIVGEYDDDTAKEDFHVAITAIP